jgi:hypothetical protein
LAIVGHPNEGKSSVVSTLAEDDSVRISPTPGETTECRIFPVTIDDQEIIRFIDTPGFQVPKQTLSWMKSYQGPGPQMLSAFLDSHQEDPLFRDECELLSPIAQGAGIIYVVDASRPLRKDDKAEMEILRLIGRPRMAIINCKADSEHFLPEWKNEFMKHFNSVRVFNAHKATYAERIALLESLKSIEQDWQPVLEQVIVAFKKDWRRRNRRAAEFICHLLTDSMTYSLIKNCSRKADLAKIQQLLTEKYQAQLELRERKVHAQIRSLFKHNIFQYDLPPHSIVNQELFSAKAWQVLGLTPGQLTAAAAVAGGVVGACLDVAAAGLTFGIFTTIGGAVGAGSALLGGERMAKAKVVGLNIGGYQVTVGPHKNIQLFYVLLDRALIFYANIINWAHGRREYQNMQKDLAALPAGKKGYTSQLDPPMKNACSQLLKTIRSGNDAALREASQRQFIKALQGYLNQLSLSDDRIF